MTALADHGLLDRLRVAGPYKGLAPFDDSDLDALLFFGRDLEREVIEANLFASRLTVLYGQTGVGKSSLLRAGLVHALRDRAERNRLLQGHPDFAVVLFDRWNGEPVEDLATATYTALVDLFGEDVVEPPRDEPLAGMLDRWTRELDSDLLLVLDQAEEYFLYHGGGQFEAELPELVTRPLRANVLLSLREDQLAKLDRFKGRIPNLFANYLRVDHLDPRAATAAIVQPLERYNELTGDRVEIEPALVEAILEQTLAGKVDLGRVSGAATEADTGPVRVEAPYLQLVLQRIWQEERAAGSQVLRLETLTALGGADEIAHTHLERALGQLDKPGRDIAASVFLHLVTPSGTKIALPVGDIAEYTATPPAELDPVLHLLARERILKPVETPHSDTANGSYEIFHDVLAEAVLAWRGRHALERERLEARRRHRRVLGMFAIALAALAAMTAVASYAILQRGEARRQASIADQRQKEALLQAGVAKVQRIKAQHLATIAAAEERKAVRAADLARRKEDEAKASFQEAKEQEQIAKQQSGLARTSEQKAEREARFAQEQAARASAARRDAVHQAQIASHEKRNAVQRANQARGGELAAVARALIQTDPELAVRTALKAARYEPTDSTANVLRDSLLALQLRAVFPAGGGRVRTASFDSKGTLALVAGAKGRAALFSVASGRRIRTFQHGSALDAAGLSPDGQTVATSGRDRRVRLWMVNTGRQSHVLEHGGAVTDVSFSRDSTLLVTASADRTARVWRVATGELVAQTFEHSQPLRAASFIPDGSVFVTVGGPGDRLARIFDSSGGHLVAAVAQQGVVTGAWWSPTGAMLVTAGRRNAYVWDTRDWHQRHLLEGHTRPIRDAAFSPDSRQLVTVGDTPRIWRLDNGNLTDTFGGLRAELTSVAFNPEGTRILTGGEDRIARLWEVAGPPPIELAGHGDAVNTVAFSATGTFVLTGSDDGTARLWQPREDPVLGIVGSHGAPVAAASFSPDGSLILSAGADGTARLWRVHAGLAVTLHHGGALTRARFVARGKLVLTAGEDGTAQLWRVAGGARIATLRHGAPIRAISAARDGSVLVTAGDDGTARIWSRAGGQLHVLRHGGKLFAAALSPDERLVATAGTDDVVRVWDVQTGALLRSLEGHGDDVTTVAFDRSGKRLATGAADGGAGIWDPFSGKLLHNLEGGGSEELTTVRFSPRGDLLVTAATDGAVRIWDVRSGERVYLLKGHVATVSDVTFSPNGDWLFTAGPSRVGVWQVATGKLLLYLRGHVAPLSAVDVASDGRRVVTASADGTVRIGSCDYCTGLGRLTAMAKARLRTIVRAEGPKRR
jgi:WD40 repeat protein